MSNVVSAFLVPHGVHVGVIPTLTMLAIRHFKHIAPGEDEPKHPAVKFVVDAWNEGDFADAEKHIGTGLAMSAQTSMRLFSRSRPAR